MQIKALMKILILSFVFLAPALAEVKVGDLTLDNAWVRPGMTGQNTAAYLTINNPSQAKDKLVRAACSLTKSTELHNHINENGIMKMRPVTAIPIETNIVELKPGSLHIMLIGLKQDLKTGENVKIKLEFEKAGKVEVDFAVVDPTKKTA